jgi:hypothetical protein
LEEDLFSQLTGPMKKQVSQEEYDSFFKISQDSKSIPVINISSENIQRQNFLSGFVLENFFSSEECDYYVNKAKEIGFHNLKNQYPEDYRNSERLSFLSDDIAALIWERLKNFLEKEDLNGKKPMNINVSGVWKPSRVNNGIKITKYTSGSFFKPHIDNVFIFNPQEITIHTILIYLNDEFEGGETNFCEIPEHGLKSFLFNGISYKIIESIKPVKGRAIVFENYKCHEGSKLLSGTKYIMKTEIVFKQINSEQLSIKPMKEDQFKIFDDYKIMEDGLKFQDSTKSITSAYLRAVDRQLDQYLKIIKKKPRIPEEILMNIISFDPNLTFILNTVCVDWNESIIGSTIWKETLMKLNLSLVKKYHLENINIIDWYGLYKKELASKKSILLCLDQNSILSLSFYKSFKRNVIEKSSTETYTKAVQEKVYTHGQTYVYDGEMLSNGCFVESGRVTKFEKFLCSGHLRNKNILVN